ncbi:unnamed protein product [marine sediment metagenome]|uniref:Uncharacterized protein n=1 Tax=marine sediment metagenome TaxID=412755 RepID=X1PTB9_9ZZZZ
MLHCGVIEHILCDAVTYNRDVAGFFTFEYFNGDIAGDLPLEIAAVNVTSDDVTNSKQLLLKDICRDIALFPEIGPIRLVETQLAVAVQEVVGDIQDCFIRCCLYFAQELWGILPGEQKG